MNTNFKQKLIGMYNGAMGDTRFAKHFPEDELKKIIGYGTMGETGENYFLFIYRDFYRDPGYYGSILFLNKRDDLDHPVTVTGIELDGQNRVRNVYVKAALFFLKNEYQNTMAVSGSSHKVFAMAKERINAYIGKKTPVFDNIDLLATFNDDISGQTVKATIIKNKNINRSSQTPDLKAKLELFQKQTDNEAIAIDPDTIESKMRAKPAINLKWQVLDLSGQKHPYFHPLLVPIKSDGSNAKPQAVPKSGLEYIALEIDNSWASSWQYIAEDFKQLAYIDNLPGSMGFKIKLMQGLFFKKMANALFNWPEELGFYQPDNQKKDYKKMQRIKFTHLSLRFAPALAKRKEQVLRFFLTFNDEQGNVIDARDDYKVIFTEQGELFVFLNSSDGHPWFAIPAQPEIFTLFFKFLIQQPECHMDDFDDILAALKTLESDSLTIQNKPLKKYRLSIRPTPVLNLYPSEEKNNNDYRLVPDFDYDSHINGYIAQHPNKIVCTYDPDQELESRCMEILKSDPFLTPQMDYHPQKKSVYHFFEFKNNDMLKWLMERGNKYLEKGFKIYSAKWKRYIGNTGASIGIQIEANIDWLQFKPMIQDPVTGKIIPLEIQSIDITNNTVEDKKGSLHLLTKKEIEKLAKLMGYSHQKGGAFHVPSKNFVLIRQLYDQKMADLPQVKDVLNLEKRLKEFDKIPPYPLTDSFNGTLRNYQEEGFKWLYFLRDYGFAGCLADDMGLGKTVQTLALLQTLKQENKLKTSLLVVPVSAIPNWESEITSFAPSLTYYRHIGTNRDKDHGTWFQYDLIITSYATIRNDIETAKDIPFDYIILDEAQNIKNAASQTSKAIKILQAKNRLALSGTPVENNSLELWSLFEFLMPGYLGSLKWFSKQFAQAIEKNQDLNKAELLKKMIYPFILRRKKEAVEKELPEKTEIVSRLILSEEQATLYAETAEFYRHQLEDDINEKGVSGSSIKILEGMLRLRQICLFPQLVNKDYKDIASTKFNHLQGLLEDILAEGHKVLVFSQFVHALKIIKNHCDIEGIDYSYIDGSVKLNDREQAIKKFQENEETGVFLLSLKAGGVALNLTAADYVIIFDPWWNPAVEAQAIDRSHRIGQTKKVMVYRMVMEGTIEEKMLQLQERKKTLVDNLITSETESFKNLSRDDVMQLFK
jgi:superfamily II DNA or RNA helicase